MMAEENEAKEADAEEGKKGGNKGLIIILVVVLLAAGAGFGIYKVKIAPMLAEDGDLPLEPEVPVNTFPLMPENYPFDMSTVNLMREGDDAAGILMYQITFECENPDTTAMIELYRPRFVDMLNKLHASRTRTEVDDILQFQISVQRQALQKANDMLEMMKAEDSEIPLKVTGVFHQMCMATDAP